MDRPNANMVTSSFDRIQGTYADPVYQPYNNFRIQNLGGNIIQGQMNKLSVTEVMMPYNLPTIILDKNNSFYIGIRDINLDGTVDALIDLLKFEIPERFYNGQELVDELNGLDSIDIGFSPATPMNDYLIWTWDDTANSIQVVCGSAWSTVNGGVVVEFFPSGVTNGLVPVPPASVLRNPFNFPNFIWTAGFRNVFATNPSVIIDTAIEGLQPLEFNIVSTGIPAPLLAGLPANSYAAAIGSFFTGRYTDYIDIVSSTLCQAQYIRDTTTSQNTTRRDVISRIYICNNMSLQSLNPEGSRPFVIHRMFPVPKVMKWTADRSIDAIDLQLFDMYGQPVPNGQTNSFILTGTGKAAFAGEADYAITFHVHEPRADVQEENLGYAYKDF